MWLVQVLISIILMYIITYLMRTYNRVYWNKRGVALYTKNQVTGLYWDFVFHNRPIFEALWDIYRSHPTESAVGVGFLITPALYVRHPTNIQYILATNFTSFNHRAIEANRGDLLADNVLFMFGERWRLMRQSLTPMFTMSRLRHMYHIIDRSAQDFVIYLKEKPQLLKGDAYNSLSTFCSAAIGAAVFGITPESVFDSPFLKMAQKAFRPTVLSNINLILSNISLSLSKALGIKIFKNHERFFIGAIKQVIEKRRQKKTKQYDFADICVTLQSKGTLRDEDDNYQIDPTDELLAAQAFFFFIAGVEPTASALFGILLELGRHPEHLRRLHDEIDQAFEDHNDTFTSEVISKMGFLDMVVCEGLRLYPPVGYLKRLCVSDCVLPVGNIRVEKGTRVFTPVYEIHHDPKYYPNPEAFIPERFTPDKKLKIDEYTYMPFGRGRRLCIGMKYAQLQVKACLVHLLRYVTVGTTVRDGGLRYSKQQLQVKLDNVDLHFTPRL